jgi:hypothetical protein
VAGGRPFECFHRLGNTVRAPTEFDEHLLHFLGLTAQPLPEVDYRWVVRPVLFTTVSTFALVSSYFSEKINVNISPATDQNLQLAMGDCVG